MKKLFVLLALFIILFPYISVKAELAIFGPKDMIKQSDLIVIGTIKELHYGTEERRVIINVARILKGEYTRKSMELEAEKNPIYGWLGFDFPEEGTRVLVFTSKGQLTGDGNNIAVIEGEKVHLYKGITMSGSQSKTTVKDYEDVYRGFLKETIGEDNSAGKRAALICGGVAVIMLIVAVIMRKFNIIRFGKES